jgi:hypothetical protein
VTAGGRQKNIATARVIVMLLMSANGDVHLAKSPFIAGQTAATVSVVPILARCAVLARIRLTFVDIDLAVVAFKCYPFKCMLLIFSLIK